MEQSVGLNVGDNVTVTKCDECPTVVGKVGRVSGFFEHTVTGVQLVKVSFGKGRPQKNRPDGFNFNQLELVETQVAQC